MPGEKGVVLWDAVRIKGHGSPPGHGLASGYIGTTGRDIAGDIRVLGLKNRSPVDAAVRVDRAADIEFLDHQVPVFAGNPIVVPVIAAVPGVIDEFDGNGIDIGPLRNFEGDQLHIVAGTDHVVIIDKAAVRLHGKGVFAVHREQFSIDPDVILGRTGAHVLDVAGIIVITGEGEGDRGAVVVSAQVGDLDHLHIAHLNLEITGRGGAVAGSGLNMEGMAGLALIVDLTGIPESDHPGFGIDGKRAVGDGSPLVVDQGIRDRIPVRIRRQSGQVHFRAIGGIFGHGIGGCIAVRHRAYRIVRGHHPDGGGCTQAFIVAVIYGDGQVAVLGGRCIRAVAVGYGFQRVLVILVRGFSGEGDSKVSLGIPAGFCLDGVG